MPRISRREEAIRHQAALEQIRARLERDFPLQCRVVMTREAERNWPRYVGVIGTVVAYELGVSPKVLWDGRKTASSYHPAFLRRVEKKRRS